jgi:hypothetical protein
MPQRDVWAWDASIFSAFSGWSRRPDVADWREKTEQLSRPAQMFVPGVGQ